MPRWETLKVLRWRPHPRGKTRDLCAASGLVRGVRGFWAVGDDLSHLVFIPDGAGLGTGYRLFPEEPAADPARRKKLKRDLEALIDLGDLRLVAFPSGSKRHRARGALIRLDKKGRFKNAREVDFRPLITWLEKKIPDLNIEGGFIKGDRLVLLQRGNGRAGFNALVKIGLEGFLRGLKGSWKASRLHLRIKRQPVGRWGRVALSFTDGFDHDGTIYYAAAAEAGKDTYEDGEILGSVVGALRGNKRPAILARLAREKIEGLCLRLEKSGVLEFYAVTDNDDPSRPARMLRVRVKKPSHNA
jgi:hypothetical protein